MTTTIPKAMGQAVLGVTLLAAIAVNASFQPPFADPIDTAAMPSSRASSSSLIAVTTAGQRLVAVGLRGLIAFSDDNGASWSQAGVATSSDLVAVNFPTPMQGWASGHDGIVVHSIDGGRNWSKQLDGRVASELTLKFYQTRADQGDAAAQKALVTAQQNYQSGPDLPFLGIWFESEREGFAVGSFGLIVATHDGGASWEPWLERIDNPDGLNLNAIRKIGDDVFIAAERGTVFKLDRSTGRFVALRTGYAGSFFDLAGDADTLLAFGLRGHVYRSADRGSVWTSIPTTIDTGITGGTRLRDGRFALVTQGGQALISSDHGYSFKPLSISRPSLFTGVAPAGADGMIVVGFRGAQFASTRPGTP